MQLDVVIVKRISNSMCFLATDIEVNVGISDGYRSRCDY